MTETCIFELLQKLNSPNDQHAIKFNEYSRLIPEHVDLISKSIAGSVYGCLKEHGSSSNSKMIDFIQLIRRWCCKDENHFSINEHNYQFLLDYYTQEDNRDILDKTLEELYGDFENLPSENMLERLKSFYDENDVKMVETRKHLDYIAQLDQERLGDAEFFTNKGNIKLDSIDSFLNNFLGESIPKKEESIIEKEIKSSFKLSRTDRAKIVYAILNLKRNENNQMLLAKIIEEIAIEQNKIVEEMGLVNYLWQFEEIEDCNIDVLNLFPFVYEIPIIRLCKELITSSNEIEKFDFIEKFQKEHHKLIAKCNSDSDLHFRILNVIYELYILSKYNENVLGVVKIFNTL